MMSKAKFEAARELIAEKQYNEARAILRTINHPLARAWEVKLNRIAPEYDRQSRLDDYQGFFDNSSKRKRGSFGIMNVVVGLILLVVGLFIMNGSVGSGTMQCITPLALVAFCVALVIRWAWENNA